jgi:flagellar protein FlaI
MARKKKEVGEKQGVFEEYSITVDNVPVKVKIEKRPNKFVYFYETTFPVIDEATRALLEDIKERLIENVELSTEEMLNPFALENLKKRFVKEAKKELEKSLPTDSKREIDILAGILLHEMLGLGDLEVLLMDGDLEEVAINNASEPLKVYHRKYGWLNTNVRVTTEEQINNLASIIGRKVGRQITTLTPLMDAHLMTGDRVNATLFPVSSKGNTLTIRKFRRKPWTITDLIETKTVSSETAAFLWLCLEYELSLLVAGGTASGKTTFVNVLTPFIPPNQRIVSIEDTRELNLPKYLHWIPMTTRDPNPEGRGEVGMLDLLVNALRMRPDRIILGEIRRQREAEVLFEAMTTGHSVYSTVHADTAKETIRRLTTPPINLPESMIATLPLVVTMYRQRRKGIRRVFEVSELVPATGKEEITLNTLFKWNPRTDTIETVNESARIANELRLHVGITLPELAEQVRKRRTIIEWLVDQKVKSVDGIGKIIGTAYTDMDGVLELANRKGSVNELGVEV